MTDRPIIFSAPMVRALLEGRKTMTRRLLKPQPKRFPVDDKGTLCDIGIEHVEGDPRPRIRLGRVITAQPVRFALGDRLWVRETCGTGGYFPHPWTYRADGKEYPQEKWRPAIHMPRRASRLTLVVTATKIEKLQEISEEDAIAEGAPNVIIESPTGSYRQGFAELWESLHGVGSWIANPELVCLTFTVHKLNIDQMPSQEAA